MSTWLQTVEDIGWIAYTVIAAWLKLPNEVELMLEGTGLPGGEVSSGLNGTGH